MPERTDRATLNVLLVIHLLLYVFLLFAYAQSTVPDRLLAVQSPEVLPLSPFVRLIPLLVVIVGNLLMFTVPRYPVYVFIGGYVLQLLMLLNRQWAVVPSLYNFTVVLQCVLAGMVIAYHFKVTAYVDDIDGVVEVTDRKLVTVYSTGKQQDIMILKSMFEEQGIPVYCKGENLQDLFGLGRMGTGFNPVAGAVEVRVAEEDGERAKEIIDAFNSHCRVG